MAATTSILANPAAPSFASTSAPPLIIGPNGKVSLPPMGTGAWAWGDSLFWGYRKQEDEELARVFSTAVAKGAGFFDTAEVYGLGRSESLLGKFTAALPTDAQGQVAVATKFAALPWRTKRGDVVAAAERSVERLGRPVDLYQIHFPNAFANAAYWDGLGDAFEKGLVRAVGVSNYGSAAVRACHAALAARGIPLSTNQVQLSLVYRCPLENGLKATCDELGVKVVAYSPLALGLLSGKYSADRLPSGPRAQLARDLFGKEGGEGLLEAMRTVSHAHGDVPLTQVALNWVIAKGCTPIPGARTVDQLTQNLGTLDWTLSTLELAALDEASMSVPPLVPPEKAPFPKVDKDTGLVMFDS